MWASKQPQIFTPAIIPAARHMPPPLHCIRCNCITQTCQHPTCTLPYSNHLHPPIRKSRCYTLFMLLLPILLRGSRRVVLSWMCAELKASNMMAAGSWKLSASPPAVSTLPGVPLGPNSTIKGELRHQRTYRYGPGRTARWGAVAGYGGDNHRTHVRNGHEVCSALLV